MGLLYLSKLATQVAAQALGTAAAPPISQLPGVAPETEEVKNGFEGRMSKPALGGAAVKKTQGPRAYAPRLKQPSL